MSRQRRASLGQAALVRSRNASTIKGLRPSCSNASRARALSWAFPATMTAQAIRQRRQQRALAETYAPFLQIGGEKTVAADRHDARGRRRDCNLPARAIDPGRVFGIDVIARRLCR